MIKYLLPIRILSWIITEPPEYVVDVAKCNIYNIKIRRLNLENNLLQIFKNDEFGNIRILTIDGEP